MLFPICFILVQFIQMITVVTGNPTPVKSQHSIRVAKVPASGSGSPENIGYLVANNGDTSPGFTAELSKATVFDLYQTDIPSKDPGVPLQQITVGIGHSHWFKKKKKPNFLFFIFYFLLFSRTEDSNHSWCHRLRLTATGFILLTTAMCRSVVRRQQL
jgi:hypothetical protein